MTGSSAVIVAGMGKADAHQPDLFEAKARATVRYADSAAWITATAVARALSQSGDLRAKWSPHEVGVVVVSDDGPAGTMAEVQTATATGFSSPLRYAAAGPGTMAGVTCIAFGFRGPTLSLTMPPDEGVPVALRMCEDWLARRAATCMVLATFRSKGPEARFGRAVLLACPENSEAGNLLTKSVADWLTGVGD